MKIHILSFTNKGYELAERLGPALSGHEAVVHPRHTSAADVCKSAFDEKAALVFIGATGIAVRSIAPLVKDKLTDPPVIVIDELGRFVIPLLSGHVGGANELARDIFGAIGAVPVITTATDISEAFSADLFAKEHGLTIANREGIARVASSSLEGKPVTICIKDYPPRDRVDVLVSDDDTAQVTGSLKDSASIVLCPKKYAIGIGCRRGKAFEDIRDFVSAVLADAGIDPKDAGCIATIDIKKDEAGLKTLSQAWRMPLVTFDAEVLAKAEGNFESSQTVLEHVGVDNVCERASVLAAGPGANLVVRKTAKDGITVAVAQRAK